MPPALSPSRVLVIDDSPLALNIARGALEEAGFEVETAAGGKRGLERVGAFRPNVVVCDLNMPEMSGVEVVAELKATAPTVPVLMFSESAEVDSAVAAMRTGAFGYVLKGAAAKGLVQEVRAALERQRLLERNRILEAALKEAEALRQRGAEEARRAAEGSFRHVLERSPDPMAIHKDGKFIAVNAAILQLLGHDEPAALIGKSVLDIVHPEDRDSVKPRLASTASAEELVESAAQGLRVIHKSGAALDLEVTRIRVVFEGQAAVLALAKDVTSNKLLAARMTQMDRLAAVGTLAAGVAHEINNPLAYITSNLASIRQVLGDVAEGNIDAVDVKDALDALQETSAGVERVKQIARDLKGMSRDDGERTRIDLRSVLESAARMAGATIRPRARFVHELGPLPQVMGNEGRLGQVFLNLLVNAAQSIAEGSPSANEVRLSARAEGEHIVVEVKDTGAGMSPEVHARLFEPFFTTKPRGVGTGLGLSICHGIVAAHWGSINVQSELGKGTTFRVELPIGEAAAS